ncbi:hypothetical protein P3G55_12155 [Leptospira sp. 96542]|nr:hypothetical protein [Leptospira sp. 96542]
MKKIIYIFLFLGVSIRISDFNPKSLNTAKSKLEEILPITFQLGIGPEKLHAAADNWGFVRQSATWARGNSGIMDSLIMNLKMLGYFNNDNPRNDTFTNVNLQGFGSTTIRIKINQNLTNISSSAYTGSKNFKNFLEIKKTNAAIPSIQLFFDDPDSLLGNNGALIYYRLVDFGNPEFANVGDVITESYTGHDSIYGTKFQTYTWRNGPENTTWISKHGRVVLTEVDSSKQLCFRSVVRMSFTKLKTINPNLDALQAICGGQENIYYGLAYMQKFDAPFYTTAKASMTTNSTLSETVCHRPANEFDGAKISYGIFDINGFVADKLTANQVPTIYPSPTVGGLDFMSVDDAFKRTFVAYNTTVPGQETFGIIKQYEDTSKAFLDGFDSSENNLNFKTVP